MGNRSDTNQLNWPRWAQVLLIAVLAVLIGNRMTLLVDTIALRAGIAGELTWTGAFMINDPQAKPGFLRVAKLAPDSPMARAGVQAGDYVAPQPSYDYEFVRRFKVGEHATFMLDHQGVRTQRQVIAELLPMTEAARQENTQRLLNALAVMVSFLIGCFILGRAWGNKTAMLLGAALLTMGTSGVIVPPWANMLGLTVPMWSLIIFSTLGTHLVLPFAMRLFEENATPLPRWQWRLAGLWLALMACYAFAQASDIIALTRYLRWIGGAGVYGAVLSVSSVGSVAYLVAGWHRSEGVARNRMALIALALLANTLGTMVLGWTVAHTGNFFAAGWLGYVNALMIGLITPSALAYAVLRHKLFDLGFAVNRTLVFATVSAILLAGFGLLEWVFEHLVPESWHEGSAFYSAGIAVGLFLLFHRIRDGVEHFIERLFFRKWQQNEAALKRFVAAAAHVEKPEALAGNFTAELARFTGGASAALYARTADGTYASASGEEIDADDPALAVMRAEQGAMVPAELGSPLEAALALPMMHQAALAGFVLLGPKPTGEDYRPDEIEVLGWATQQIGLDLQAIRVRELEVTTLHLAAQVEALTEIEARRSLAVAGGSTQ